LVMSFGVPSAEAGKTTSIPEVSTESTVEEGRNRHISERVEPRRNMIINKRKTRPENRKPQR